jgi:hypothetical protein
MISGACHMMATPPHNSVSYGKNGQVLAGADDLIQLIGRKVIVGKISQHNSRRYYQCNQKLAGN